MKRLYFLLLSASFLSYPMDPLNEVNTVRDTMKDIDRLQEIGATGSRYTEDAALGREYGYIDFKDGSRYEFFYQPGNLEDRPFLFESTLTIPASDSSQDRPFDSGAIPLDHRDSLRGFAATYDGYPSANTQYDSIPSFFRVHPEKTIKRLTRGIPLLNYRSCKAKSAAEALKSRITYQDKTKIEWRDEYGNDFTSTPQDYWNKTHEYKWYLSQLKQLKQKYNDSAGIHKNNIDTTPYQYQGFFSGYPVRKINALKRQYEVSLRRHNKKYHPNRKTYRQQWQAKQKQAIQARKKQLETEKNEIQSAKRVYRNGTLDYICGDRKKMAQEYQDLIRDIARNTHQRMLLAQEIRETYTTRDSAGAENKKLRELMAKFDQHMDGVRNNLAQIRHLKQKLHYADSSIKSQINPDNAPMIGASMDQILNRHLVSPQSTSLPDVLKAARDHELEQIKRLEKSLKSIEGEKTTIDKERIRAFDVAKNSTKIIQQGYYLNYGMQQLLKKHGFDPKKFATCTGNQIQQQLHKEVINHIKNSGSLLYKAEQGFYFDEKNNFIVVNQPGIKETAELMLEDASWMVDQIQQKNYEDVKNMSDMVFGLNQLVNECIENKITFAKGVAVGIGVTGGLELGARALLSLSGVTLSAEALQAAHFFRTFERIATAMQQLDMLKNDELKALKDLPVKERVYRTGQFIGSSAVIFRKPIAKYAKRAWDAFGRWAAGNSSTAVGNPSVVLENVEPFSFEKFQDAAEKYANRKLGSVELGDLRKTYDYIKLFFEQPGATVATEILTNEALVVVTPEGIHLPVDPGRLPSIVMTPEAVASFRDGNIEGVKKPVIIPDGKSPSTKQPAPSKPNLPAPAKQKPSAPLSDRDRYPSKPYDPDTGSSTSKYGQNNAEPSVQGRIATLEQELIAKAQELDIPVKKLEDGVIQLQETLSNGKKAWRTLVISPNSNLMPGHRAPVYKHAVVGEINKRGKLVGRHEGSKEPYLKVKTPDNKKINDFFDHRGVIEEFWSKYGKKMKRSSLIPQHWNVNDFWQAMKEVYQKPLAVVPDSKVGKFFVYGYGKDVPFVIIVHQSDIHGFEIHSFESVWPYHENAWQKELIKLRNNGYIK